MSKYIFLAVAIWAGVSAPAKAPEPADDMTKLKRFSTKLGLAIGDIPAHEGLPLGNTARVILLPLIDQAAEAQTWPARRHAYEQLLDGCNRCHAAMEKPFVHVRPVPIGGHWSGVQVFNREAEEE